MRLGLGASSKRICPIIHDLRTGHAMFAILTYHGVTESRLTVPNSCQMPSDRFAAQMAFLAHNCRVLPLRCIVEAMESGEPLPTGSVALTFDDGFRNFYTTAFPILMRFDLPATAFLVTSLVGTDSCPWPEVVFNSIVHTPQRQVICGDQSWPLADAHDRMHAYRNVVRRLKSIDENERAKIVARLLDSYGSPPISYDSPFALLNWEEVQWLRDSGLVDFGSHTHTHPILAKCDEQRTWSELSLSHDILLGRLGVADLFAYPNGTLADFLPMTRRFVQSAGFRCGLTNVGGGGTPSDDVFAMNRINISANVSLDGFKRLVAVAGGE